MKIKSNTLSSLLFIVLSFVILFTSCTKEVTPSTGWTAARTYADTLKVVDAKIYSNLKQFYLWYDKLPGQSPSTTYEPDSFLNILTYKTYDKWSFILTYDEYMAEFVTGNYYGHGFSSGFDQNNNLRITYVFNNTDLHTAGVRRGWIIKSVNGIKPNINNINGLFGPSQLNYQNNFTFTRPDGKDTSIIFVKKEITRNTVLAYDTLHVNNKIVGYISFLGFELDADSALKQAFTYLLANNATELVLDLRYNGGGSLNTAQNLADMIAGQTAIGQTFVKLTYNDQNTRYNETWKFLSPSVTLNLNRLFVITTGGTASASEAVINGLKPYMDVYLIGSKTDGKPVGMLQFILDYNYYLYAIDFKTTNASGYGDYFNGLPVDQEETDDITHDFGDRNEACLNQALHYIQSGTFAATQKAAVLQQKIYSETPQVNFMFYDSKH